MSSTITKKDLIEAIAQRTGQNRAEVRDAIQTFLDLVIEELAKGNRLEFRDFGVFESRVRAPRRAQNPKTLAPVEVPARRTVKFKIGRLMRGALDAPASVDGTAGRDGHADGDGQRADGHAGRDGAGGGKRRSRRPANGRDESA